MSRGELIYLQLSKREGMKEKIQWKTMSIIVFLLFMRILCIILSVFRRDHMLMRMSPFGIIKYNNYL